MASTARRPARQPARQYDSSRRTRQAAQTRAEVLAAAVVLFNEHGWAATKLADIAAHAGVAVETIYSGFGSKKGLLRAAMDVAVVGDAAPVPFSEREEFLQLGRGPLDRALPRRGGRDGRDPRAFVRGVARDRRGRVGRRGSRGVARAARARPARAGRAEPHAHPGSHARRTRVVDLCWSLYSPEVYTQLTRDAGWSRAEYEQWLCEATVRLLELER